MLTMEEFLIIRDLYNQGLNISQIAQKTGFDRKTVRKYLSACTPPSVKPRTSKPSKLNAYKEYIQQRITEYPLSATRLYREIQEMGYTGKYTIVKDYIRSIRPPEGTSAASGLKRNPVSRRKSTGRIAGVWTSTNTRGPCTASSASG